MLDFYASVVPLVLFLGKGLEILDVHICYGTGGPGWMHPSGYWMLDFYASVVSLVLFLGKRLGKCGLCILVPD